MNTSNQSKADADELAVKNLSCVLALTYQDVGTKILYSDEEIVFQAAARLGNKPILENLLHLRKMRQLNLNLSFHGAEALKSVIQRASVAGMLPEEQEVGRTAETIELIQLLVSHGVRAKDDHLNEAIYGKNLELVQYLITQQGLDVGIAIRSRIPGSEEIREWAKEWRKVNQLKTKLSSSLNKKCTTKQKKGIKI